MLRLLHTADWHLGHALHGHDRSHEHQRFLRWLTDTIVAEQVDALIIAGDVFDTANPPTTALAMYFEFLAEIGRRRPGLDVVVIGGNHDSAARLHAPEPLLSAIGVSVVGGLSCLPTQLASDQLIIPLHDASGAVAALVAALPFMRPGELPQVAEDAGDPLVEGVRAAYAQVVAEARRRRTSDQALIATGHCYMVGTQISAMSERRVLGGNQHALPDDIFEQDIGYVALGHMHKAQRVGWREWVRYSGSPLPLSMGEADYRHQVVVVDFEGAELADWRPLYVPRTTEMIRIAAAPLEQVCEQLAALPAQTDPDDLGRDDLAWPYLEVNVALTKPVADLREQIEAALQGKRARLVKIACTYLGDRKALGESHGGQRLADLDPQEVLRRRYQRDYGGNPPAELLAAFDELLDGLGQAESA